MRQLNITENEDSVKKQSEKNTPKTLLQHVECIIELVENSGLNEEFFKKAKRSISLISKRMKLTTNQVILFSVFIEQ